MLARIFFLILTPVFFRALNFAFVWHSIYWGVVTWVVVIWGFMILLSPLIGRFGCGWLCFIGTLQDLPGKQALFHIPWSTPRGWRRVNRIVWTLAFFGTAFAFFFINMKSGTVTHPQFNLGFLGMNLDNHYRQIWLYDCGGALLFGFMLDKRWMCRNLCMMGGLCAAGATLSRLIPVVDTTKCNSCGRCDRDCLVKIPITQYVAENCGLVTSPECLVCGKCIDSCYRKAISVKFVWDRKKYRKRLSAAA